MSGIKAGRPGQAFGRLLRQTRSAAGLSQDELAQRSGLSVRGISDMERGFTARPFNRSVRLLADAMMLTGDTRDEFIRAASGDAAGRAGPGGSARPPSLGSIVPQQLPAGLRNFAGRARELTSLGTPPALAEGAPDVVTISGTAGVGKTTLAVHFAHQAVSAFPDGQLYVNLRGFGPADTAASPPDVIRDFIDAFGVPANKIPASPDAQAGLYRNLLAGQRALVILDNALDEQQVRPLLPSGPGCLVVVTSRSELVGLTATSGARHIMLDVLSDDEARKLLAGRLGSAALDAEPGAVTDVIRSCARLPLALAIAAARAADRPGFSLSAMAAELRDTAARLDALDAGDPAASVRAVFALSYQQLSAPAARMFRLLGLHPGPDISASAAASLADVPESAARQQLRELARGSLLAEPSPGRYAFHDLLRVYATELAEATDDEPARRAALARVLDHYLHTAYAAALLIAPSRQAITLSAPQPGVIPERLADDQDALNWYQAEYRVLGSASTRALTAGFGVHAWQLPYTLHQFLDRKGQWHEMDRNDRTALTAVRRLDDKAAQALVGRMHAYTCVRLGDFEEATVRLVHALELSQDLGDSAGEALAHTTLGWLAEHQGQYAVALSHAQQALERFRAIDHRPGQAAALNNVGIYSALTGDYTQAKAYCQEALVLHRELGADAGEAATWDSLGYAEHQLGRYDAAIACFQHALAIIWKLGDRYAEAETLTHLGDAHHEAGHARQAREEWQKALVILNELDSPGVTQLRDKIRDVQAAAS